MVRRAWLVLISFLLWPFYLSAADIITFSSGTITLQGVIYRPEGTGPFPAVIYNHGSAAGMLSKEAFDALGPVFVAHRWVFFGPYRRGQGLSVSAGPYIDDQIEAAKKAGGILTVLGAEKGNYCAAVVSATGTQSWALAPELHSVMTRAVRNARTPIFFFQAANDYNLSPSKTLATAMGEANKKDELKIYPAYGASPQDGHTFGYFGAAVWAKDVFEFLSQNCANPKQSVTGLGER